MKATAGPLPKGDDWAYELKWDGVRIQATTTSPTRMPARTDEKQLTLTLRSLSGRDVTDTYPELATLRSAVSTSAILDGEVVAFDDDRPSFARLQHRMHVDRPTPSLVQSHPVFFVVFDLLELDGNSLLALPYATRRRLLRELLDDGPNWLVPPESTGDGQTLVDLAADRGLEGVVAKRLTSTYTPGARSRDWVKVKVRRQQEFVVCGTLPGQGMLAGTIGSLVLGVWDSGRLLFCGSVGSGLTDADRKRLDETLTPRETCPFPTEPALDRVAAWVEPNLVVEVGYGDWPEAGSLRHPVFLGIRADHRSTDVVRELPS